MKTKSKDKKKSKRMESGGDIEKNVCIEQANSGCPLAGESIIPERNRVRFIVSCHMVFLSPFSLKIFRFFQVDRLNNKMGACNTGRYICDYVRVFVFSVSILY